MPNDATEALLQDIGNVLQPRPTTNPSLMLSLSSSLRPGPEASTRNYTSINEVEATQDICVGGRRLAYLAIPHVNDIVRSSLLLVKLCLLSIL